LIAPYRHQYYTDIRVKYRKLKAGVFIYDPATRRTLLVQSRGCKWGAPKGTIEDIDNNSIEECALREVLEETGIQLTMADLTRKYMIDRTTYYYLERPMEPLRLQTQENNDANGITWIKTSCIVKMFRNKSIDLNSHCKKLLAKFLNVHVNLEID
jgi:ADP-ribose pyrophosphatase YjhB (NUDIX family)